MFEALTNSDADYDILGIGLIDLHEESSMVASTKHQEVRVADTTQWVLLVAHF